MLTKKQFLQKRTMTRFALMPLISMLLMMLAASASSAQSTETCTQNCIQISREDFAAAKKAGDEVKVSRVLIGKQVSEIELLRENVALKDQVIALLKENSSLKDQRAAEKDTQIASEKAAREATEKQLMIETKEKEKAQRKAKFWRKIGVVAGGVAAGLLYFH